MLKHFTTDEIHAEGWLRQQLEVQASGLSGNLDKIWPDVRDSKWIGGDRDGWERVPYWLDGFIPLAFLTENADMQARAKKYVYGIISGQQEDGWLCPCKPEERAGYDMWALYLILKVLTVWYDCTKDESVVDVIYNALKNLSAHIDEHHIFGWAHSRWFECLIPIYFVYGFKKEEWLLDLCDKLHEQGMNYDELYSENWPYKQPHSSWDQEGHVVNQGMAIKAGGLYSIAKSLRDGSECDDSLSQRIFDTLMKYHGTAVGHFNGDECLSGISPIHGAELCSVVEAMYSYEELYEMTENPVWIERAEEAGYNALPGACSADMWTHQYDQMTNQVCCDNMCRENFELEKNGQHTYNEASGTGVFFTNSSEANMFGLEPNFGCCTANFNQGWPKLALSAFYAAENGIAVGAIAPASVTTEINGVKVTVESDTKYPFGDTVNYIVTADKEVDFTLTIRIPYSAATATVDGDEAVGGDVIELTRTWSGKSVIAVVLKPEITLEDRPTGLHTIRRGSLFYTLDIGEEWTKREYTRNNVVRQYPYCDYDIHPTTEWQYALASADTSAIKYEERDIAPVPYAEKSPACVLAVEVYPIDWGWKEGYEGYVCAETPKSTVPTGEKKTVFFKPYGASDLHLTELPIANK